MNGNEIYSIENIKEEAEKLGLQVNMLAADRLISFSPQGNKDASLQMYSVENTFLMRTWLKGYEACRTLMLAEMHKPYDLLKDRL